MLVRNENHKGHSLFKDGSIMKIIVKIASKRQLLTANDKHELKATVRQCVINSRIIGEIGNTETRTSITILYITAASYLAT